MFQTYARTMMTATRIDPFEMRPAKPGPVATPKRGLWDTIRTYLKCH